jgi:hypothetical protein
MGDPKCLIAYYSRKGQNYVSGDMVGLPGRQGAGRPRHQGGVQGAEQEVRHWIEASGLGF